MNGASVVYLEPHHRGVIIEMLEDEIEYYKVSADRVKVLAEITGLPIMRIRQICMAPWPDDKVHQQWLDESSVEEIARWVLHTDKLERQGEV